ncbi:MAG: phosphoribosyltransferase family protein [bacterium]|nr:phosphoribosyltransferase family protein [bacterium]
MNNKPNLSTGGPNAPTSSAVNKLFNGVLNFIFPVECLGCGKKDITLCESCSAEIPFPETEKKGILAGAAYSSPVIQRVVKSLKYRKNKLAAKPLADLLFNRIKDKIKQREIVIVPAPLSKKRLSQRGFNQALLIAEFLSDKFKEERSAIKIVVYNNVLYKNRDTSSQVEIKERDKRLKNLEGVFFVNNNHLIQGKTIFVIDDVSTTGATINEAKRALKNAGAKRVVGLVVAQG